MAEVERKNKEQLEEKTQGQREDREAWGGKSFSKGGDEGPPHHQTPSRATQLPRVEGTGPVGWGRRSQRQRRQQARGLQDGPSWGLGSYLPVRDGACPEAFHGRWECGPRQLTAPPSPEHCALPMRSHYRHGPQSVTDKCRGSKA